MGEIGCEGAKVGRRRIEGMELLMAEAIDWTRRWWMGRVLSSERVVGERRREVGGGEGGAGGPGDEEGEEEGEEGWEVRGR